MLADTIAPAKPRQSAGEIIRRNGDDFFCEKLEIMELLGKTLC
jgi:hypothetical protein